MPDIGVFKKIAKDACEAPTFPSESSVELPVIDPYVNNHSMSKEIK
jgi:hypothetical protein